ncbi:hypothetical protein MTR_7g407160 [Medicago truncatula]|uniref:Uncharacterized protein n=1 Tax=Medicago truncatula TaxID=3880 RepID=A0A072U6N5_MEDTR|nr:hypothetical protein MTR_7g407160 [Medicago truncatula]
MDATRTGKKKSIYFDTQFLYEIINSNEIQIYKDLELSPTGFEYPRRWKVYFSSASCIHYEREPSFWLMLRK